MKTQIITALSIVAVLGSAGGAYAINQTVLGTASSEQSVIGSATPVLVPVAPKGADIPAEYRQRLADAVAAAHEDDKGSAGSSSGDDVGADATSSSSSYADDDQDESDDESAESEDESDDDGADTETEHEDETDDDD